MASLEDKKLLRDKVFISLLSYPRVSIKLLLNFVKLDRSTLQKHLEGLVKLKLVKKLTGEENKKEFLYEIKPFLRAKLDEFLIRETIKRYALIKS